jgi:hypothetical protein
VKLPALAAAIAAGTFAQTVCAAEPMPLTYDQFEAAVPHLDLERCPEGLPQAGTFCRATINHHEVHVFTFSEAGEFPLIAFKTYAINEVKSLLE